MRFEDIKFSHSLVSLSFSDSSHFFHLTSPKDSEKRSLSNYWVLSLLVEVWALKLDL